MLTLATGLAWLPSLSSLPVVATHTSPDGESPTTWESSELIWLANTTSSTDTSSLIPTASDEFIAISLLSAALTQDIENATIAMRQINKIFLSMSILLFILFWKF